MPDKIRRGPKYMMGVVDLKYIKPFILHRLLRYDS